MSTSSVSISNLALSQLGGNLITSLDDETTEAALCKANYEPCRDAVLEDRDWTFATDIKILSPLAAAPAFGYAYKFELPSDLVRILMVSDEPKFVHDFEFERRGSTVHCDSSIVYLKYIMRVTDPSKFSAGFVQALAARLALEMALPLTHSAEIQAQMQSLYGVKLERAGAMDGLQGKNQVLRSNRLLRVR